MAQFFINKQIMFLKTIIVFTLFVSLRISCVNGACSYAADLQLYNELSRGAELYGNDISSNYLSSPMSYDTYDTDCYKFVQQPPQISDKIFEHAFDKAIELTKNYDLLDNRIIAASKVPVPKFLKDMDRNNYYFESATKYVQETTCSSKITTSVHLPLFIIKNYSKNVTKVNCGHGIIKNPKCSTKILYRSFDGTCNNLKRPLDGQVGDCTRRLLPPDYKNAINELRTSMDGSPLPNSRLLSSGLFGQDDLRPLSTRFTQFHTFFGEFIIGDSGMTLTNTIGFNINIQCCDRDGLPRDDHPQCASIFVPPKGDELNRSYPNQKCMEFVRSIPCARCKLGPRSIANSVTAALDLNSVYGVSREMSNARRTMKHGRLKSQMVYGEEIFATERFNASGRYRCFKGFCEISPLDIRNVQLPTGQVLALLFHRNHNRHASNLAKFKPHWNDEMIFQEARKWNIAQYQHSVYNEYLETILGIQLAKVFEIPPRPFGQYTNYKPNIKLQTLTEYQSTAGRHGHNALTEEISIIEPKSGREYPINFRQSDLFEKVVFHGGMVSGLFLGLMSKPAIESTASIPFKTFLYDLPGRTFGLDLASLDIQRQRDHGIPGYVNYLKYCHNSFVYKWEDLHPFIASDKIVKLKQYYKHVEDVELYVGGHYERKIHDALVGPTFGCIIAHQFRNSKYGDRFFYEHGLQNSSFTIEQLNEVKAKSTMASILCKNTDLEKVLVNPFRVVSYTNRFVPCKVFEEIDYNLP